MEEEVGEIELDPSGFGVDGFEIPEEGRVLVGVRAGKSSKVNSVVSLGRNSRPAIAEKVRGF